MALAKASVVMLYRRIDLYQSGRYVIWTVLATVGAWALLAVLALAFQCKTPEPWVLEQANCPYQDKLNIVVASTNIITDVVLVLFILPGITALNMRRTLRFAVIALFSSRLL
jgi:hypothetical protein